MDNVGDILSIISDHGFADANLTTKVAFLNDTIADFCAREPWPFLEQSATLAFDGTNPKPSNLPTDIRAVLTVINTADNTSFQPFRLDTLEKQGAQLVTQQANGLLYYFQAGEMRFAPIPPASTSARLRYLRFHPAVTSSTTSAGILVPSRHWMLLVFGTLVRLYDMEDDPELSARFEGHYESRIQKIRAELWTQQYDRPDYVEVTDPDFLDYEF